MNNEARWQPSKFEPSPRGLRASRDRAEVYVGSRLSADGAARWLEGALRRHARGRLLDMGAGKAPLYGVYRPLVDTVTCVDWARSLHGTDLLDAQADLNGPLPFEDASFETVVSTSVFEHLWRPDVAWAEASRVLAPGGALVLHVPFLYGLHEEPYDFFRYTEHALRAFCAEAGLALEELTPTEGGLTVVADQVARLLGPLPALSAAWVGVAGALLGSRVGRRLNSPERVRRAPLGYGLVARKPESRPLRADR